MTIPQSSAEAAGLAKSIRERLLNLDEQYSGEHALQSSLKQIEYIMPFLDGNEVLMPRMEELNFGFYGVRFVAEFDRELGRDMSHLAKFITDRYRLGSGACGHQ